MGANNLIYVLREHEVAHLGAGVDIVDWLQSMSVPEADTSISSAASRCEETVLMRTPTYCLYCGCVIGELSQRLFSTLKRPHHQFVIVSTRS
jgi:hypothetical protein